MADRRIWTNEEEDMLIAILQDIVLGDGRSDNGCFRAGTYELVKSNMRERIPNTNITSKHVMNKIKRLKDKYSAAYDMLNTSGFGWSDENQCVTVDSPTILEEYLKKHPNKNYTANKSFPAYERLKVVFGKDRATGNMAESAADALENMDLENEDEFATENPATPPIANASNATSISSIPNEEGSSKKRKRTDTSSKELTRLVEETKNEFREATNQMKKLVTIISESTPDMDTLSNELSRLGLGMMHVIRMGKYFGDKPTQYKFWKTLEDDVKLAFVESIVDGDK